MPDQAGDLQNPNIETETLNFNLVDDGLLGADKAIDRSRKLQDDLAQARLKDIRIKLIIRIVLTIFFVILLLGQNLAVFLLVFMALKMKMLYDLQLIFSVLIPATLTETYWTTNIIVEWMCKKIDYKK